MTSRRWYDPLDPEPSADADRGPAGSELPDPSRPSPLDALLSTVVEQRGWRERLRGARVHGAWEEIAGPELARHSQPVRLHGGVLVLRAASPAWATQVRYLGAELVERANAVLGPGQVQRITVVAGRPGEPPAAQRKRR